MEHVSSGQAPDKLESEGQVQPGQPVLRLSSHSQGYFET